MDKPVTLEKLQPQFPATHHGVRIGHVRLQVADLQRNSPAQAQRVYGPRKARALFPFALPQTANDSQV
jgi:catechol-2,3-dioxygenase